MKNQKRVLCVIFAYFVISLSPKILFCHDNFGSSEIEFIFNNNSTNYSYKYQCVPISAVYNKDGELNLRAKLYYYANNGTQVCYFNNGVATTIADGQNYIWTIPVGNFSTGFNCDLGSASSIGNGNFGAGIYKVRLWAMSGTNVVKYEEITVEVDASGVYDTHFNLSDVYDPNLGWVPVFDYFLWNSNCCYGPTRSFESINFDLKEWDPYPNDNITGFPHNNKNFGNFVYANGNAGDPPLTPNDYSVIPQLCVSDCDIWDNGHHIQHNQQNTGETATREGRIPLNTTFKKNIATRNLYPLYGATPDADIQLSAEPGVSLIIGNGNNYSSSGDISFELKSFSDANFGNILTIKDPGTNNPTTTLSLEDLEQNQGYTRNAKLIIGKRCNSTIQNRAKLYCGKYSQILVNSLELTPAGTMDWNAGSIVEMKNYSQIIVNNHGLLNNKGTAFSNTVGAEIKVEYGGKFEILPNVIQTISAGGILNLDGGILIINDNAQLIFDGASANFIVTNNSSIQLGANAKIEFKNGASLIAYGSTITSIDGQNPGVGFILEDAGAQTSITNCTFTNLKNSIKIVNNTASTSGIFRNIDNNTFSTNSLCNIVIELRNTKNINVTNNHITMAQDAGFGIIIGWPYDFLSDVGFQTFYGVNIGHNYIYNGEVSCFAFGLTNVIMPINYIDNHLFEAKRFNFAGNNITGVIKDSYFTSTSATNDCVNFELTNSVPNVLSNHFISNYVNISLFGSYPKLAPANDPSTDAGWVWVGGHNTITSSANDNINFDGGYATLDWGQNCFSKNSGQNIYYVEGIINCPDITYNMRNNDFNGTNSPSTTTFNLNDGNLKPKLGGLGFACPNPLPVGTIWQINDLGNGIKDTIYTTPNNSGIQPTEDQVLYSHSIQEYNLANYFSAISYLKTLINNYPNSNNVVQAAIDLYTNYGMLDTSGNQGIRNILYNDLKYYLDNKITSGLYGDDFNFKAYAISLMCLDNMTEYNDALTGYEFIALYHPESYVRLIASWDYDEIQSIMNGAGGVSSKEENFSETEFLKRLKNRVTASINEDPVKQILYKSYKNGKKEKDKRIENEVSSKIKDEKTAKSEILRIKAEDTKMEQKAVYNLRYLKTFKKEEKEKMKLEDLLFSRTRKINSSNNNLITPKQYELTQNYPNPFNPSTTIKYSLPKDGRVLLKIYDITGREIKTLVNEVKTAGNYIIEFTASDLSSGIYFYRIQAGDFVQTKRMVLVK